MSFNCLVPRVAYQENEGEKPRFLKGSEYEFYLKAYSKTSRLLLIPCGKCPNCLARKSQEWTSRLMKEMESHKYAYFITLTYESLITEDGEIVDLNKRDIQLFLKRYRKYFEVENLKYYICGEYGEETKRPHYHAIFFQDKKIPDLKYFANDYYISKPFQKCWSKGHCLISKEVNERNIKYTIAYTLKKLGENKIVLMSKGLGLDYINSHKESIKDHDGFYVQNGYKQKNLTYLRRKLKESSDISDQLYLQMKDSEPKDSIKLSGDTIPRLISEFLEISKKNSTKGKGAF